MRSGAFLALLLLAVPVQAGTLGLAWGKVAEPAAEGEVAPGRVAEHLEFLRDHGWRAVRTADAGGDGKSVVLSFDDPASALRYLVPLLDLYRMPAVVTVGPAQAADPELEPVLRALAASPWIELAPRVEAEAGSSAPALRCDPVESREADRLDRLRVSLKTQVDRLRSVTGVSPSAVAWEPGAWSGPAETVAADLGLKVQLPTFTGMPPSLGPPRVARFAMPSWAGVWAPVQASVGWDPKDRPVRFVEVDAAWVCAAGDPEARLARVIAVMKKLGLNGVRVVPGEKGVVVGALTRRLHEAGVRWVMVDLPQDGEALLRSADLDVAILPAGQGRLAETVHALRPAALVAWREEGSAFRFGATESRGTTVGLTPLAAANDEAARLAIAGWDWLGLPFEPAEEGLGGPLRALAAFALPQ